jgi:hypothetical protein
MVVVNITTKEGKSFKGIFETIEEAQEWVSNHKHAESDLSNVELIDEKMDNRVAKMQALRKQREHILFNTDWLMVADVRYPQKHRKAYIEYRQYLRDCPKLIGSEGMIRLEPFENWLRRKHPEEFLDGGEGMLIIKRFKHYLGE